METVIDRRVVLPEKMDAPDLDPALHRQALNGLKRINRWSGTAHQMFQTMRLLTDPHRPMKVLDIATGGGDLPIALAQKARKYSLPLDFHACDKSDTALDFARRAAAAKKTRVRFFKCDILRESVPHGTYDIIISSLFVHHLSAPETFLFLKKIAAAAKRGVMINDLQRSPAGLLLAQVACRLLTTSPVVHEDGPQSVRAGYSIQEIKYLALSAGMQSARIKEIWPFRYQLVWRKT